MVALAVAVPALMFGGLFSASAQFKEQPKWAVLPFSDDMGANLGMVAATQMQAELAKQQANFDPPMVVRSEDEVTRTLAEMGLTAPVTDQTSLLRFGQSIGAKVLITGHVVNERIVHVANGKQAQVIITTQAVDVASGLPINGAALAANSQVKADSTPDTDLYTDALDQAAANAVAKIMSQTLPQGTVLNTYTSTALINQGTRSGFEAGQTVIITRRDKQVGIGKIQSVQPDESTLQVTSATLGVQPGDNVRVIFQVPNIATTWASNGSVHVIKPRHSGNTGALISVLLVAGLLAVLLGGGNGSSTSPFSGVTAQALYAVQTNNAPGVQINFRPDGFIKSSIERQQFLIFRSDVAGVPVTVSDGQNAVAYDSTNPPTGWQYYTGAATTGTIVCNTATLSTPSTTAALVAGRPYTYSVELVYALNILDVPGLTNSGSGSGGSNGGLNGGSSGGFSGSTGGFNGSSGGFSGSTGGFNGSSGGFSGGFGAQTTGRAGSSGGLSGTTGGTTGGTTTGSTTGTTATTTGTTATTTGTTATTTGTTSGSSGSTGSTYCWFVTPMSTQSGIVTPIQPPTAVSPADGATFIGPVTFSATSVVSGSTAFTAEYVLEVSADPTFQKADTYAFAPFTLSQTSVITTPAVNLAAATLPSFIKSATTLYWRIGGKNVSDNPGPVPDSLGLRYVFPLTGRSIKKAPTP